MNREPASAFRRFSSPLLICLLLAVATLAVYSPVRNYGFVDYDDSGYFFANPHVLGGLTGPDMKWAFTSGEDANWHPLTWLTLMLDAQFFGKSAAAPHVTNVLLHLANSILVFLWLRRWTGALWRSAAVAMLFAIHPMHVESVAWVAERKDVLSGFFGLLVLWFYSRYAKENSGGFASPAYWLALLFFGCGLMSKPMLVTLPFVMLLVDFWPLQRFHNTTCRRLFLDKIPFFLLSAAASVVTFIVQQKGGAVTALNAVPPGMRIENTFVSYGRYLERIFWPFNLATPYPPPHYWPVLLVLLCAALFILLCAAAVAQREKYPFLFTGWFWFAGMLVPVIGLVQVGGQAMADRYVYLPSIGILIAVIWGLGELGRRGQFPLRVIFPLAAILFFACALRARNQVTVWKDDFALFDHALATTKNNYIACLNIGYWYSQRGNIAESLNYYHDALQMAPNDPSALYNVGNALARYGDWSEAISDYRRALQITPNQADVLNNLGFAFAQNHQLSEAAACFEAVLKLDPHSFGAHVNLAIMDFALGRYDDASLQYQAALQLSPNNFQLILNLGDSLARAGQKAAAAEYYRQALQLQPGNPAVRARLQSLGRQNAD